MAGAEWQNHLAIEGDGVMRIRKHGSMNVDAMIVSSPDHLAKSSDERSISQLVNIASMPGVVGEAWAMADWHFGYGFPIGGVLATDVNWGEEGGSISPEAWALTSIVEFEWLHWNVALMIFQISIN